MLVLPNHSASSSLTMLSYDREAGMIVVKATDPTPNLGYEVSRLPLAKFLHDIGIPFPAVRDVTRVQQGVWRDEPEPTPEPEPTAA